MNSNYPEVLAIEEDAERQCCLDKLMEVAAVLKHSGKL